MRIFARTLVLALGLGSSGLLAKPIEVGGTKHVQDGKTHLGGLSIGSGGTPYNPTSFNPPNFGNWFGGYTQGVRNALLSDGYSFYFADPDDEESGDPGDCGSSDRPVSYESGQKVQREVDFTIGGQTGFQFLRTYISPKHIKYYAHDHSYDYKNNQGHFGENWYSPFDHWLRFEKAHDVKCRSQPGLFKDCWSNEPPNGIESIM